MRAIYLTPNIETLAVSVGLTFPEALRNVAAQGADENPQIRSLMPGMLELTINQVSGHVASQHERLVQTLTVTDMNRARAIYAILHDIARCNDIVWKLRRAHELWGDGSEVASGQRAEAVKAVSSLALLPITDGRLHTWAVGAAETMAVVLVRSLSTMRMLEPAERPPKQMETEEAETS
jgi:hypothetical protein